MSWICYCNHQNEDEVKVCVSCGLPKPAKKDMRVIFDAIDRVSINSENIATFYLSLAYTYLEKSKGRLDRFPDLKSLNLYGLKKETLQQLRIDVENGCNTALYFIPMAKDQDPNARVQREGSPVFNISELTSYAYFLLGRLNTKLHKFQEAIDYFEKAYDTSPNQSSLYNIAFCSQRIPAKTTGFLGSAKKDQEFKNNRKENIIKRLQHVVVYNPLSAQGLAAAQKLYSSYGVIVVPDNFEVYSLDLSKTSAE